MPPALAGGVCHWTESQYCAQNDQQLFEHGKLIKGRIVHFQEKVEGDDHFYVLHYAFTTPDGREKFVPNIRVPSIRYLKYARMKSQLADAEIPVAVLYLDDDHFKLL